MCFVNGRRDFVQSYYLTGHVPPQVLDSKEPSLGVFNPNLKISGNYVTCSFSRLKSVSNPLFANLNGNSYYVLSAYGAIAADGRLFVKIKYGKHFSYCFIFRVIAKA